MVQAVFERENGRLRSFSVDNHAGYGEEGEDIVCAAVSSAVQLTANGITEILGAAAEVKVDSKISLSLEDTTDDCAQYFMEALLLQLTILQEDYPEHVAVSRRGN